MPTDQNLFGNLLITNTLFIFKIGFVAFASLYFIFSLIVIRQVGLMTETVKTQAAPILRFISFLFALFSLLLFILFMHPLYLYMQKLDYADFVDKTAK